MTVYEVFDIRTPPLMPFIRDEQLMCNDTIGATDRYTSVVCVLKDKNVQSIFMSCPSSG